MQMTQLPFDLGQRVRRHQPRFFRDERLQSRATDVHIPQRRESRAASAKALSAGVLNQFHQRAEPLQALSQRMNVWFAQWMCVSDDGQRDVGLFACDTPDAARQWIVGVESKAHLRVPITLAVLGRRPRGRL